MGFYPGIKKNELLEKLIRPALFIIFSLILIVSCNKKECRIETGRPEMVSFKVLPFKLSDVTLLDGSFKHATELNAEILLNYESDRFLAKFRSEAGLEPKAEHYHGWEDNTIAGHSLGHYLSAFALMYQTTGNERFLQLYGVRGGYPQLVVVEVVQLN